MSSCEPNRPRRLPRVPVGTSVSPMQLRWIHRDLRVPLRTYVGPLGEVYIPPTGDSLCLFRSAPTISSAGGNLAVLGRRTGRTSARHPPADRYSNIPLCGEIFSYETTQEAPQPAVQENLSPPALENRRSHAKERLAPSVAEGRQIGRREQCRTVGLRLPSAILSNGLPPHLRTNSVPGWGCQQFRYQQFRYIVCHLQPGSGDAR